MKRYTTFLFIMVYVSALSGCGSRLEENTNKNTQTMAYFEATVLSIKKNHLLVEPAEDTSERKSADQIQISTNTIKEEQSLKYFNELEVGDIIQIGYDGVIAESYPAQISAFEIKFLSKAEVSEDMKSMVMVKGILYYDTGKETTITGRCGVMDGEITSTVGRNETPTEDNQSNFGTGYGYQFVSENQIEVLIDNEWIVFDSKIEGANPVIEESPVPFEPTSITEYTDVNILTRVAFEIKENTLTNKGLTVIIKNDSEHDLIFGSFYAIEKEIDGSWYRVPYLEHEYDIGWDAIGYPVNVNSSYEFEATNWEWLYGTLDAGKYRFVKNAIVGKGNDIIENYFAVEFTLTE